jgi:hypothetical protein
MQYRSTSKEYDFFDTISGAIYSTLPQYEFVLDLIYLARPKSVNLAFPKASMRIF